MAGEPDDGEAAWAAVAATVRPLKGRPPLYRTRPLSAAAKPMPGPAAPIARRPVAQPRPTARKPADTLDARWDERLRRGAAAPDATIDLHGFPVAAAHAELEAGLARAVARGARVVLLITGRAPPPGRSRLDDPLRGIIRASVHDWLERSANAGRIAAIRAAHPRHGGAGALYLVLRRAR